GEELVAKIESLLQTLSRQQSALVKQAYRMLSYEPIVKERPSVYKPISSEPNYKKFNLTAREIEICSLLHTGLPYKIIAEKLNISVPTVNRHVANLFQKLNVKNKLEA